MDKQVGTSWRPSWWPFPEGLGPYVVCGLLLLLAVGFWAIDLSHYADFVAYLQNQARANATAFGYDATPFIALVAAEVQMARLQWFLLELSLIVVAFLVTRELTLIRQELWERKSEAPRTAPTGSGRKLWPLLAFAVPILICTVPFLVAAFLALSWHTSLYAAMSAAPEPVSRFGQDFDALVSPSRLHPGNAFLFPFIALVLVHQPLHLLRRSIQAAREKGLLKVDLDIVATLQKPQVGTTGLTSGSQSC
jgi:hypothetical protein